MLENIIWRLTKEDFEATMKDMNLAEEQQKEIIDKARQEFNIYDWQEYVQAFINTF